MSELENIISNAGLDVEDLYWERLVALAQHEEEDTDTFAAFYELVFGNKLPPHQRTIVDTIYGADEEDKGALIFAWRGSWKTTTISIGFVAYRMGRDPHRANLIIQANDDTAQLVVEAITKIILESPAWEAVFPDVRPNEEEGWGADGYYVKDYSKTAKEWNKMTVARKDPSLLGLGIRSRSLIGKHPDGVLLMDDILDEENTKSDKENQNVINKVTGTILPFIVEDFSKPAGERMITWPVAVGTPWRDDDAYHYLKGTGEMKFVKVPAMREVEEGAAGAVEINDAETGLAGWYNITWPEQIPIELILTWRRRAGAREFARMYLLDLDKSKITGFQYTSFPAEKINLNEWATSGGVDFASVRTRDASTANRDYFAMAYIAKVPTGGAVIFDGHFGHSTQAMSEAHIQKVQNILPKYGYTHIEEDGKGEAFIDILMRKPHIRVMPEQTGGKGKPLRQEKEMAPWFEIGIVRISDADTPFLNLLRRSFDDYPDGNDDVRDAAYWACKSVQEVLVVPDGDNTLPNADMIRLQLQESPFNAFGG